MIEVQENDLISLADFFPEGVGEESDTTNAFIVQQPTTDEEKQEQQAQAREKAIVLAQAVKDKKIPRGHRKQARRWLQVYCEISNGHPTKAYQDLGLRGLVKHVLGNTNGGVAKPTAPQPFSK